MFSNKWNILLTLFMIIICNVKQSIFKEDIKNKYMITVYTGDKVGAGTDAHVFINLVGSKGSSGEIELSGGENDIFERNEVDTFIVDIADIGPIQKLLVRHDNANFGASWYLEKIDVTTEDGLHLEFPYENWIDGPSVSILVSKYTRKNNKTIQQSNSTTVNSTRRSIIAKATLQPLDCSKPLGMYNGLIQDSQLSATTSLNDYHLPFHARLNRVANESYGGWCPFKDGNDQYLQIDFSTKSIITGIATQGLALVDEWTTAYELSYLSSLNTSTLPSNLLDNSNKSFIYYQENLKIKNFTANTDQNTTVTNWLDSYIYTSVIRLYPVSSHAKGCVRVEFYGCNGDDFMDNHPEHVFNDEKITKETIKTIVHPPNITTTTPLSFTEEANLNKNTDNKNKTESVNDESKTRVVTNDTLMVNENAILILDFDYIKDNIIQDISGHSNDASIHQPVDIVTSSVSCGKAIRLNGGSLFVDGEFFMDKPNKGITVTAWIKLFNNGGQHTVFTTVGALRNGHNKGVGYILEVERGQLKWSHRNNDGVYVFNTSTGLKVPSHTWTHIAATYDASKKESHLFVNGKLSASSAGIEEELSQDWSGGLIIGSNHDSKLLNGELDDFIIFKKALAPTKIEDVMRRCDFESDCHLPIGMESKLIPNSAITASTHYNLHRPEYGRLNLIGEMNDPARTAWCADTRDSSPYIQIELPELTTVTAIATQGLGLFDNWITGYIICYGTNSNETLLCLKEKGTPKVWPANVDKAGIRHHSFKRPITAKVLQLKPISWFGNHLCLRMEIYGCKMDLYPDPFDTFSSIPSLMEETESTVRDHIPIAGGDDCNTPLGVSNGEVDDMHMSASSELGDMYQARYGRLLHDSVSDGTSNPDNNSSIHGCWCSKDITIRQYLEVDLGEIKKVTAVATQGFISKQNWVSTYRIGYGDDYGPVHWYTENGLEKIFSANNDSTSIVKNYLNKPFLAKYVRINPRSWNGQHICLRIELFGCHDKKNESVQTKPTRNDTLDTFVVNHPSVNETTNVTNIKNRNETSSMKNVIPFDDFNTNSSTTTHSPEKIQTHNQDELEIEQPSPPSNKDQPKSSSAVDFKDTLTNSENEKLQNITYSKDWEDILDKYPELLNHGVTKDLLETVYSAIPDIENKIENFFKDSGNSTINNSSIPLIGSTDTKYIEAAAPPFNDTDPSEPIYIYRNGSDSTSAVNGTIQDNEFFGNGSRKNIIGSYFGEEPLWFNSPPSTIFYSNAEQNTNQFNLAPNVPMPLAGNDDIASDWMDPNQTPWTSFTDCSQSCGVGVKMRHRRCEVPACPSPGTETQTIPCIKSLCPGVSRLINEWSPFTSCTSRCGVGKTSRFRICNGTNCPIPGYETQIAACWNPSCAVLKLDFETIESGGIIIDASGYGNHGKFVDGARIVSYDNCGHFIDFGEVGKILLPTVTFRNKPSAAITIACWINLYNHTGKNSIFTTERTYDTSEFVGGYHFEIDDGSVRWFHRNNESKVIFSAFTDAIISVENVWTHIAVSYDMSTSTAKIFVDGSEILSIQSENAGSQLSTDWGERAIIGDYEYDNRHFSGFMDDFIIYDYVISKPQLDELLRAQPTCNASDPEKWP